MASAARLVRFHRRTSLGLLIFYLVNFFRTVEVKSIQCPSSCSCLGYLVDCSNKGLIDVPKDLPIWVEILELQSNDITSIPDEAFRGLINLKQIDMSNNQIRRLTSTSFLGLTDLKELKLAHNRLTEVPHLGSHPNLSILHLHHNDIYNVNGSALESLPNLQNLDLSYNRIVDLEIGSFPNTTSKIQHLSLQSNRIGTLERGVFDHLKSLEWLKLNKNQLTTVHKDLFRNLSSLKHLELNRNQLTHIEGLSFQGLESLQVLKLKRNNITQLLDGSFYALKNIKHLHLDYNNISLITKGWLYGLEALQQLTVSHNSIVEVEDDAWNFCKRLLDLDLTYNQIETIGKVTFSKLHNLRYLYLDYNKILYIEEGAFKSLSSLQVLELNNNDISWTIEDTNGAFTGLDRLMELGLANNQIKSIAKKAFLGLGKLKNLDLTLNPVTSIQENPFLNLKSLQKLHLNSTSLLCDCQLKWLPSWLLNSRTPFSVSAVCGHPAWMKGMAVTEANSDNFTCDDFPKPYITEEPKTRIALKGANITLVCKGATSSSSSSDTTFQWRKDNKLLLETETENFAESQEGGGMTEYVSLLHLRNVQDQDEGRYQCVISNHLGSVYSQRARITVHVFPVFTKVPKNVTAKAKSTTRLECAAKGQPPPEIAWTKDGGDDFPAARERRMHVMPTDDIFFITNVKPSDMGVYTCTAQNAAGTVTANATLTVLETPSFVKPMEDKQTMSGETAVLECMASGSPKPKLNWTKDGGPLVATERHFFTAEGQLLIIVQTQMSDMGRYVCEMINTLGAEKDSAYLTVTPGANYAGPGVGGAGGVGMDDDSATTGIIIIAVVCCVVGTSLVWVVIIYQTRKRSGEDYAPAHSEEGHNNGELAPFNPYPGGNTVLDFKGSTRQLYSDSNSEHSSKDSGTGESAKQSSDELLTCDDLDHGCHDLNLSSSRCVGLTNMAGSPSCNRLTSMSRGASLGSMVGLSEGEMGCHRANFSESQSPLLHTFLPAASGAIPQNSKPQQHPCEGHLGFSEVTSHHPMGDMGSGIYYSPNRGDVLRPADDVVIVHKYPRSSYHVEAEWTGDDPWTPNTNYLECEPVFCQKYEPTLHPRQRCFSAEQLNASCRRGEERRVLAEQNIDTRSSGTATPSGRCATYPSSLSATSWSMGSLQAGQQEVPNDSGSFSIVSSVPGSPLFPRNHSHRSSTATLKSSPTTNVDRPILGYNIVSPLPTTEIYPKRQLEYNPSVEVS